MAETLSLCVSCKACRRECPTGVDMARMKIEVLAARASKFGLSLHERLVGYLPRYAPYAAKLPWLLNLRDRLPGAAALSEAIAGFSARRSLPRWRSDWFKDSESRTLPRARERAGQEEAASAELGRLAPSRSRVARSPSPASGGGEGPEVVLFADTFNRYFERENLDAALTVLTAAGYRVHVATPADGSSRPLCCGRTFLSVGKVDEARREAERVLAALDPFVARGVPVVGLEPSCILGFRDEIPALLPDGRARALAGQAMLFEEFLAREAKAGRLALPLGQIARRALVHGHCHQKSFDAFAPVATVLALVPGLEVETVESSCCGMAGAFGYAAATIDASRQMGELALLPAVRKADADTLIVADGTSCRQQIKDGAGRGALHVARVLAMSLERASAEAYG
jgi:Fe-S oxidoreductase